jgi:hypothetical protein
LVGRSEAGRFLIRRLLPAAVVVPVVLGWLRLEGQRAGLYGTGIGVLLMTAANVLILSALILWSARLLDRLEASSPGRRPEFPFPHPEAAAARRRRELLVTEADPDSRAGLVAHRLAPAGGLQVAVAVDVGDPVLEPFQPRCGGSCMGRHRLRR